MLEKRESETENEDCGIKLHTLHLRLKNCGIMGGKVFADGKFIASGNILTD